MRLVRDLVRVQVPATSANLGPGFDTFGLALALHDTVEVRATAGTTRVEVTGEGAGEVPDGEDHLVVRAVRAGLEEAGAPQAGLELRCHNAIPHGRGLGSSAAAVVAGLIAARGLISDPDALSDDVVLRLAAEWEGHPDNAAAALLGGATLAWTTGRPGTDEAAGVGAVRLDLAPGLTPTVLVPGARLLTSAARAVLPPRVAHADAVFNAARTALLVVALGGRHDLLMTATQDRLHQPFRGEVMAPTLDLVARLRADDHPAAVSGAGPSVLVLGEVPDDAARRAEVSGWQCLPLAVDDAGAFASDADGSVVG
ncbi:homoserine kinase [Beutenbergia cavernae DSM 12333]|uniref:Homoserine kinase n=1 Tax=Beutenbergia cavernae (strain ATCC BAA-8 / DSM 12333 / CCUG 43141 / JCM 11478 / NBRC 16432 / NCIMB 13614 / HKI 0122) TaxID=471853 RepID=C5C1S5_BEUC1|nr:homoserine kinase [Beutenbergia cavernae]ACQ79543.1 homoserine kinase [Beutenbergia cavernae DSM 12333]